MALANSLAFMQHECGNYDVLIDDYGKEQFLTIAKGTSDATILIRDYYTTLGFKRYPTGKGVTITVEDWVQLIEQHERVSQGIEAQINQLDVSSICTAGEPDAKIGQRLWYKINDRLELTILPVSDKLALGYDRYYGVRVVIGYQKRKHLHQQQVQLTPEAWSRIMFESNRLEIANIIMAIQKEITSTSNQRKDHEQCCNRASLYDKCLDLRLKFATLFHAGQNHATDRSLYAACLDLHKL